MPSMKAREKKTTLLTVSLIAANLGLICTWLIFAPPGLDGKIRAIGYAICHQIGSHSLYFGSAQFPFCARCTGLFLGALAGSLILLRSQRYGQLPSKKYVWILAAVALGFVIDGINSTLFFFDGWRGIYPPGNLLRLATGLGMGIVVANFLIPLWNQILWADWADHPPIGSAGQFAMQIGGALLAGVLIYSRPTFLYFPAAVLTGFSVILLLTMVYTLLWTLGLKKENTFTNLKDAANLLLLGFFTAALQLAGMALLRFTLTKAWTGFQV